ncbi:MAG: RNA polymerase sigma factor [Acidimicrobiales bacterium]
MTDHAVEGLLRELAPRALGAVVRRYGNLPDGEDAVQEALVAASTAWPAGGVPENPLGWLVRVASRRMADQFRSEESRRRREDLAASWSREPAPPPTGRDDTLALFFMCCHPALAPASAVALTLRALGGLTTREIATAFLVPEATMAQRISRAKRTVADSGEPFALPDGRTRVERVSLVRRVIYLIFNEGYATSSGPDLERTDLATEAIRLGRLLRELVPDDPEVTGLLALMLLTEARRPARTTEDGALVPLAAQDRTRWDRALIAEGTGLAGAALGQRPMGEYAGQAAVAALHDAATRSEDTDWQRILALYTLLEQITDNPVVRLNRAVALAMVEGPDAGLGLLDELGTDPVLARSHRLHAVRAHLLERKGDVEGARAAYATAAAGAANVRERDYLVTKAARQNGARESQRP